MSAAWAHVVAGALTLGVTLGGVGLVWLALEWLANGLRILREGP